MGNGFDGCEGALEGGFWTVLGVFLLVWQNKKTEYF
jgi:hypothetical protein